MNMLASLIPPISSWQGGSRSLYDRDQDQDIKNHKDLQDRHQLRPIGLIFRASKLDGYRPTCFCLRVEHCSGNDQPGHSFVYHCTLWYSN